MSRKLLVATRNPGKVREYAAMLSNLDVDWLSLDDVGISEEVPETADTFVGNALLKAAGYAAEAHMLTLADDSGLQVDALGGAPGVQTARYGGEGLSHEQRYHLLLEDLKDVPLPERDARFRCVIALADAEGNILGTSEGICEGQIALAPAGEGGFGYDPVFYLPELDKTMAEISAEHKHEISHRGRALQAIAPLLQRIVAPGEQGAADGA